MREKIYLKLDSEPKNVRELLKCLYNGKQPESAKPTFKDKDCNILQCKEDKIRSIYSIFNLVRTYFPKTSNKRILETLMTLHKNSNRMMHIYYCPTICKPVLMYPQINKEYISSLNRNWIDETWKKVLKSNGITIDRYISTVKKAWRQV